MRRVLAVAMAFLMLMASLPPGTDISLVRQDGKFLLTAVIVPQGGQDKIRLDFSVRVVEPEGWPDIRFALTGRIRDSLPVTTPSAGESVHEK